MSKPLIGITAGREIEEYGKYPAAVELAGGEPEFLDMDKTSPEELEAIVARFDGILFTGGWDVHPNYYPSRTNPGDECLSTDELLAEYRMTCTPERDAFEIPLAQLAYERKLPMMGICKGFQVMNVALGGSLIKDIRTGLRHPACKEGDADHEPGESAMHAVAMDLNSRFYHIMWTWPCVVNSRHHQGITLKEMSPKLKAAAFAPDGIVEAVEAVDHPWAIAVQWHPERQADSYVYEPCRALFKAFVAAAGR
jgi:putative glutamine amidotransferase